MPAVVSAGRLIDPTIVLGPAPCDACRHRATCQTFGLACRSFREYVKGADEHVWRQEPNQPRADLGEDLGLLKITDSQIAELVAEVGVYRAADALHWTYHRLRKRIDSSAALAACRRPSGRRSEQLHQAS